MIVINPLAVTAANLTASNVLENDYTAWSNVTSYSIGNRVMYDHRNYEALTAHNGKQPDLFPLDWLDLGANNRYAMFDDIVGTQTTRSGTIEVTIQPNRVVNSVALLNCSGLTARVRVNDPTDGMVYDETVNLQDNSGVIDWYTYFFEPIIPKTDVVFLDLPNYGSAEIIITIDAGVGTAAVGVCVIGGRKFLGYTNYGSGVGTDDYSRKERDAFGNFIVTPRAFSKRADFDVAVETKFVDGLQLFLTAMRTTPAVYVGSEGSSATIIYGFYRRFNVILSGPAISKCNLEVEGLT